MKPNDIINIDEAMMAEVNPHNYDSDEDYYNDLHGSDDDDEDIDDYDDEVDFGPGDEPLSHYERYVNQKFEGVAEAEGDCEGLPHLTKDLAKHISQQIDTEGPHAVEKSIEWGDGAAEELLAKIKEMLDDYAGTMDESAAWQKKSGKNKNGGLNAKGVASYRREHPGSKLQTAVTTKPSKLKPGSKAAKRRKSFCARMGGMKGPMKDEHGKPTRKALALRKWNCESVEQYELMLEYHLEKVDMLQESLRTENPCWKGYKPVGTKKKNGKTVPNCVPNESANPAQQAAIAIAKKKEQGVAEGQVTRTATGLKHTGDYGNKHGKEDVLDQYGHRIGSINHEPKSKHPGQRGRPKKDQTAKSDIPDYKAMFESTLNEFASCGGTGGIATSMAVGNPKAGSLFGGSYSQKNSPFKKTAKKRTGKMIKR